MRRLLNSLRAAWMFLTILPWPSRSRRIDARDIAASRWAFPVVGALIGLLLVALDQVLQVVRAGPFTVAFVLTLGWVAISGGLHLDGLADSADGLCHGRDSAARLAIMHDPHVGAFGVAAVALAIVGKFALLSELHDPMRSRAVFGAAVLARTAVLVVAGRSRYPRPDGAARWLLEATTPRDANLAAIILFVVAGSVFGSRGLVLGVVCVGCALGVARASTRRLGGVTGDVLGALIELVELTTLGLAGLG